MIQVHGGGWILGSRAEQGIPLLNHLAANGWIGFNVDYWLSPRATLPEHVIDVKRAIAWVREQRGRAGGRSVADRDHRRLGRRAPDRPGGADRQRPLAPARLRGGRYLRHGGGSLLRHLRHLEALDVYAHLRDWLFEKVVLKKTIEEDPELYRSVSPTHRVHSDAPPFLVFHGDQDSLVPVEDARAFVKRMEETSRNPVLYVEMPGAEHAFDIFPSLRTARVVEGIERFLREEAAA